jgi:hypothetical protein
MSDPLTDPIEGADHRELGGVEVDVVPLANGRLKRAVYPPGHRWTTKLKDIIGTDLCEHAHVGFLARGHVKGEYEDGCTFEFVAPAAVVIEPGHDAWVEGGEPAVLIQFDYEGDTADRFGPPGRHAH